MTLFRLIGSYEIFVGIDISQRLVRIDVFESLVEQKIFRTRVWLQNSYNMYPTFLNLGKQGENLSQIYSSDQLNTEITSLIAENSSWATGISYETEQEFIDNICMRIIAIMR